MRFCRGDAMSSPGQGGYRHDIKCTYFGSNLRKIKLFCVTPFYGVTGQRHGVAPTGADVKLLDKLEFELLCSQYGRHKDAYFRMIQQSPLDKLLKCGYNIPVSGCGEVWYRAWFGSKRPWVRIPSLRPKNRQCSALAVFQ